WSRWAIPPDPDRGSGCARDYLEWRLYRRHLRAFFLVLSVHVSTGGLAGEHAPGAVVDAGLHESHPALSRAAHERAAADTRESGAGNHAGRVPDDPAVYPVLLCGDCPACQRPAGQG